MTKIYLKITPLEAISEALSDWWEITNNLGDKEPECKRIMAYYNVLLKVEDNLIKFLAGKITAKTLKTRLSPKL